MISELLTKPENCPYPVFSNVKFGDTNYRLKIKVSQLFKYFKGYDSSLSRKHILDSIRKYLFADQILEIKQDVFQIVLADEKDYFFLDKENPYRKEILKEGLINFLKKICLTDQFIRRSNKDFFYIKYRKEYSWPNEFNLIYLMEALFEYDCIYEYSDVGIGFTKLVCAPNK